MGEWSWVGAVAGALVGVLGVGLGSALNYVFTKNRFFQEKEWEKKREIYGDILAGLKKSERAAGSIVSGFSSDDPEAFNNSQQFLEWVVDALVGYKQALDVFARNFLFVSPEVRELFAKFEREFTSLPSRSLPNETWVTLAGILRLAIDNFNQQALKEVARHRKH